MLETKNIGSEDIWTDQHSLDVVNDTGYYVISFRSDQIIRIYVSTTLFPNVGAIEYKQGTEPFLKFYLLNGDHIVIPTYLPVETTQAAFDNMVKHWEQSVNDASCNLLNFD